MIKENENVRLALNFLIGVAFGLGAYWFFDKDTAAPQTPQLASQLGSTTATVVQDEQSQSETAILVSDQQAGKTVTLQQVSFTKPGWATIADDVNGTPGKILGAKLFDAGTHTGTIDLLRATEAGKSYLVVLRSDDGNYKNFNPKTDLPLKADSGHIVMMRFTAGGSLNNTQ